MTVRNQELAKIFFDIANYLEMEGVAFKPAAYRKAALALESLVEDVIVIYEKGGRAALEEIPGVGKNIADRIEEYIKFGRMEYYNQLKKKFPLDLGGLIAVEGLGPKKANYLYKKLGIKNVKDLEKAAKSHQVAKLFGFGETTEKNILQGIEFLKKSQGRFLLGDILPKVNEILAKLRSLPEVTEANVAGSVRRRKETIGDVDILVMAKDYKKVMDFFVSLPGVSKIWMKGPTKSSVRMAEGFDVDLRVVRKKSYGSALQYFTGSKEHNIATRRIAMSQGLKLSEYGLFRGEKMVAGWLEPGVYKFLGLSWIEPELREGQGEIEAASRKTRERSGLPKLIGYQDIRGDLHCHSDWDGGLDSIKVLALTAQKMGYEYLGIADHTKFLRIEKGLDEKKLAERNKQIDKLNAKYKANGLSFRVLKGCEANILNDGSIDIKDSALRELDFVIAGVHSSFKMEKRAMTARIIKAMENPNVDIISHPTGRILKKRDEYQIDFDRILRAAKEYGTILEINACPERLDLNDLNIRRAKESGVRMIINTDAHEKSQMKFMELGIAQARRGWAEKKNIINCQPLGKLLTFFKK